MLSRPLLIRNIGALYDIPRPLRIILRSLANTDHSLVRDGLLVLLLSIATYGAKVYCSDKTIVVGVVLDGPSQRQVLPVSVIARETRNLTAAEFDIQFPPAKISHGGWHIDGIRDAVAAQLADPSVDVVIANGLIASHEIMRIKNLPKPVIATIVADPILQKLPFSGGRSARKNLVYLADDHTVGSDLDLFHSLIPFTHLAILVDQLFIETLPELSRTAENAQQRLAVEISLIPVEHRVDAAMAALPSSIDAVYLPPLPRFDDTAMRELANALIARNLPSFSLLGRDALDLGVLMTGAGRSIDITRSARRIALNLQSIALGEDPGRLRVGLSQPQKLAINMRTAKAIGYSPKWRTLERAIVLNDEPSDDVVQFTLVQSLQRSISHNLGLRVDALERAVADDQLLSARAAMRPQVAFAGNATRIDADRVSPQFSAERNAEISLSASQLIFSERVRSNIDIAKLLREAEDEAYRTRVLDLIERTAIAYLEVLQAQASESVRASNVSVTEQNLELARARRKIGQAGRGDALRWESQLASERQSLYAARANRDRGLTELKRLLDLDLWTAIEVSDKGIPALVALLDSERFQRFFYSPKQLAILQKFQVETALQNAPELREIEARLAGSDRDLRTANRAYYLPDLRILGQAGTNLHRGGAGSNLQGTGIDDEEWSLGVEASLPLFEGGARRADVNLASHRLVQNRLRRDDIRLAIEARAIAALQNIGGSYPAMRLSTAAAQAARQNLELVTNAYSVGTMSVTDLIDAQDADLGARLSEAQARYAFMIDFVAMLRAVADFDLLLEADGTAQWYAEMNAYFNEHGG